MKQFTAAALIQAATASHVQMKVHDAKNLAQVPDELPALKESCCTPVLDLTSENKFVPPTKEWICDKLKNSFFSKWDKCVETTTTGFEEIGTFTEDITYGDSYNHHYDINGSADSGQRNKIDHITTWFNYFCGGVESPTNDDISNINAQVQAPNSGRASKGQGPYGTFPGFVDSKGKKIW